MSNIDYKRIFNPIDFGAVGDGISDDTAPIQEALNEAEKCESKVFLPAGKYKISTVKLPRAVSLYGDAGWGIGEGKGGTRIIFDGDDDADGCIDISDSYGCVIHGISVEGQKKGKNVCGIFLKRVGDSVEDTAHIENCRVADFSSDGLHFDGMWCDSVRHSLFENNGRYGIFISGWDVFLYDNVIRKNASHGLGCEEFAFNSVTAENNRFEENGGAGLQFKGGNLADFGANTFRDNGGPGIEIGDRGQVTNSFVLSGNSFSGNGRKYNNEYNANIYFDFVHGFVFNGNVFSPSVIDGYSPRYAITHKRIWSTFITNNILSGGFTEKAINDLGGNNGYVFIENNVADKKAPLGWEEI